MSQEVKIDQYFWIVGASLAHDKRVFITSGGQEHCAEVLAGGASELVCIGDSCAIEGVKARADYRERRSSKDLIIDVAGEVEVEVIEKLLKKRGALLSVVQREWSETFTEVRAVVWSGDGSSEKLTYADAQDQSALFWVAAKSALPSLPEIERAVDQNQGDDLTASLQERLEETQAELARMERSRNSFQGHYRRTKEQLGALETARDEATAERDELKKAQRALKREARDAVAAHESVKQSSAEREQTLLTQQSALSEEVSSLRAEVSTLKESLNARQRELELNQNAERELAESRVAQEVAQEAYEVVADAWSSWLGEGLTELPTRPPLASAKLITQWASQLLALRPLVTATLPEYQEISELRSTQRELKSALDQVTSERDEARGALSELRSFGGLDGDSLRVSLSAERALRVAQERELESLQSQLSSYRSELAATRDELDQARQELLGAPAATIDEPRLLLLEAQVKAQEVQRQARERLMQVNHQLQLELTAQLEEEMRTRVELQVRLEATERSLREFEVARRFPDLESRPAQDETVNERSRKRRGDRGERRDRGDRQGGQRRDDRRRDQRQDDQRGERRAEKVSKPKRPAKPTRPTAQRLTALSDQLKRDADQRAELIETHASQPRAELKLSLQKLSKRDQKRIKRQAVKLKDQYQVSSERAEEDQRAPVTPYQPPEQSSEERLREAERAQEVLRDRLKALHRRGKGRS